MSIASTDVSCDLMQSWLYDVMETERRIVVVREVIEELEKQINSAGSYIAPTPNKAVTAYSSSPKWIIKALVVIPIALINLFVASKLIEFGALRSTKDLILSLVFMFFVLGFTLWLEKPLESLGSLVASIPGAFIAKTKNAKAEKEWEEELASRKNAAKERLRIVPRLKQERLELLSVFNELTKKRVQLYKTNYLDKAYHGLVPVGAMYGYLKTGRCSAVYGHGGIIDTYVHDQQFAILNSKLDAIIVKLDEIRDTQVELANALDRNNAEIQSLRADIGKCANRMHADNQQMIECQRYANDCLGWIASIKTYEWLRS